MNILIIAKFWDSSAGIGALRPMKIAKYLLRAGHNVTAICGADYSKNDNLCYDLVALRKEPNYLEIPAFNYSGIVKIENDYYTHINNKTINGKNEPDKAVSNIDERTLLKKRHSLLNKLKWFIYKTLYNTWKVNNTVRNSIGLAERLQWEPDIILSSYAPEEVHFLARKLKTKNPNAFWIADFRDPMANSTNQKPYEYRYRLKREKRIIKKADAVTIVSQTWRNEFAEIGCKNVYTVFSGFDREDFNDIPEPSNISGKLVLTYTGSLYPGLSDLRPLFKAFSDLIQEGVIQPENLKFVYAGAHGDEFEKQSKVIKKNVEIDNRGFIPRTESLKLLKESDVLLHALFCTPGLKGIITGKLGEYWISGKPILAIVTGTVRADEFISIIEKSETGFAYDGMNATEAYEKLKEYILTIYNIKMRGEKIPYNCNESFISNFDYRVIANRFVEIAQGKN